MKEKAVTIHLNLKECKVLYIGTIDETLKLLTEIKNLNENNIQH